MRNLKYTVSALRRRRTLKIGALALPGAALVLGASLLLCRNVILESALNSRIRAYQSRHKGVVVSIDSARFSGLDRIVFKDIRLWSQTGPLTVDLRSCRIKLSIWKMFVAQVRPKRVEMNDLTIDLREDSLPDQDTTRTEREIKANREDNRAPAYSTQVNYLLNLFFTRIPDRLEVDRLTVNSSIDGIRQTFHVPRLAISSPDFDTKIEFEEQGRKWGCRFAGSGDRRKRLLAFGLSPLRAGEKIHMPFITRQWGAHVSFDSVNVRLKNSGLHRGVLHLDGLLAISGLTLNHPRIAAEDVFLKNARLDYALHIGRDFIELDRPTRVSFNKLSFHPYLRFNSRPAKQLTLEIDRSTFKADDFFSSLPAGLFTRLAGIQTSGELAYRLNFFIDFAQPKSLRLESDLEKRGFKIERFGRIDFRAVNEPFLYTVYEKDRTLRTFVVGPENPDFRTLEEISPFLRDAVLISEDGAFFEHKGFLIEHFKKSIVANLKERRFVRGGSTITMQLVKNLYLERQKTIARKLEEMIITWLIEENRLITKERMYEIYLNVIEWGPGINGAQEAARFYFQKDVKDLTLGEAIFMAGIIPRPSHFMYSLDEDRRPRPWLKAYYSDVSYKMLKRQMISQQDFDTLIPDIRLKGPARFMLKADESAAEEPPDRILFFRGFDPERGIHDGEYLEESRRRA
ncbi:MAG: transglycosylase domain-containing protein [Candidatus Krumholzibacteria bacterium]|nr:transglycosylase domain-containing protein [Candidatus Krumholzibacteria bacterium]